MIHYKKVLLTQFTLHVSFWDETSIYCREAAYYRGYAFGKHMLLCMEIDSLWKTHASMNGDRQATIVSK